MRRRRAYVLYSTIALVFLLTFLLGVVVLLLGYSLDVRSVYQSRMNARSELFSLTNISLKWLKAESTAGRVPKAHAVEANKKISDCSALRVFLLEDGQGGEVAVFDLGYNPENMEEPMDDPLLFPPAIAYGYMIRARVRKEDSFSAGLAPITMETVLLMKPNIIPGKDPVYILDEEPLFWRELLR